MNSEVSLMFLNIFFILLFLPNSVVRFNFLPNYIGTSLYHITEYLQIACVQNVKLKFSVKIVGKESIS